MHWLQTMIPSVEFTITSTGKTRITWIRESEFSRLERTPITWEKELVFSK